MAVSSRTFRLAAVTTVAACTLLSTVTVSAASAVTPAPVAAESCAFNISTAVMTCKPTYHELVLDISRGAVTDIYKPGQVTEAVARGIAAGSGKPAGTSSSAAGTEAVALSQFLLVRLADDINQQPANIDIFASGPCDTNGDVDWNYASMPSGWNDRVSSFRSYSNCETKIWENTFSGAQYGPVAVTGYVGGAMNDRTSSMEFF